MKIPHILCALGAVLLPVVSAGADETTETLPNPPDFSGMGETLPAAPVPAAPVTPMPAPVTYGNPADERGFVYERERIKRTVPLDPSIGLDGRWDLLYQVGQGSDRRAVYFNWDADFLYVAAESNTPGDVRVDVDARGDGWFRGADNVSLVVAPPLRDGDLPRISAQRWDVVQNPDRPVWADSPIPASEMNVVVGRTPAGAQVTMIALPRTEMIGLSRRPGTKFGLRVDFGAAGLTDERTMYLPRPLLDLTLTDMVPARAEGLSISVEALPKEVVPGDRVRAILEVRNNTSAPIEVARLFLRGSQNALSLLDASTFTGVAIKPGQTVKREFQSTVSGAAGLGSFVITGGIEREDGSAVAGLAAFDRINPYSVVVTLDDNPVPSGATDTRTVVVAVQSRSKFRARGQVNLELPQGWTVQQGDGERDVNLSFEGDIQPLRYKVVVPATALPGEYQVRADVRIGGRSYSAAGTLAVGPPLTAP